MVTVFLRHDIFHIFLVRVAFVKSHASPMVHIAVIFDGSRTVVSEIVFLSREFKLKAKARQPKCTFTDFAVKRKCNLPVCGYSDKKFVMQQRNSRNARKWACDCDFTVGNGAGIHFRKSAVKVFALPSVRVYPKDFDIPFVVRRSTECGKHGFARKLLVSSDFYACKCAVMFWKNIRKAVACCIDIFSVFFKLCCRSLFVSGGFKRNIMLAFGVFNAAFCQRNIQMCAVDRRYFGHRDVYCCGFVRVQ